jgi:hypothetical protein
MIYCSRLVVGEVTVWRIWLLVRLFELLKFLQLLKVFFVQV